MLDEDEYDIINLASETMTQKPRCQYGLNCFRKNPKHFEEMSHPQNHPFYSESPKTLKKNSDPILKSQFTEIIPSNSLKKSNSFNDLPEDLLINEDDLFSSLKKRKLEEENQNVKSNLEEIQNRHFFEIQDLLKKHSKELQNLIKRQAKEIQQICIEKKKTSDLMKNTTKKSNKTPTWNDSQQTEVENGFANTQELINDDVSTDEI